VRIRLDDGLVLDLLLWGGGGHPYTAYPAYPAAPPLVFLAADTDSGSLDPVLAQALVDMQASLAMQAGELADSSMGGGQEPLCFQLHALLQEAVEGIEVMTHAVKPAGGGGGGRGQKHMKRMKGDSRVDGSKYLRALLNDAEIPALLAEDEVAAAIAAVTVGVGAVGAVCVGVGAVGGVGPHQRARGADRDMDASSAASASTPASSNASTSELTSTGSTSTSTSTSTQQASSRPAPSRPKSKQAHPFWQARGAGNNNGMHFFTFYFLIYLIHFIFYIPKLYAVVVQVPAAAVAPGGVARRPAARQRLRCSRRVGGCPPGVSVLRCWICS
jgi:hypothetical protein